MCSFVHISVANYAYNFNYRMGTICVVDVHVVFLFVGGSKFMFIRYTRGTGTPFFWIEGYRTPLFRTKR